MKALQCTNWGVEHLAFTEIVSAVPSADEVCIAVHACSLSFPDLLILQNKYQYKPELPYVPGGEFSGVVESVGDKVQQFKKGDRVIAINKWGGLAEKACVKISNIFPLPDEVDFNIGASSLYAYGTSYHALKDRAQIQPGETLLILGASGGVGLAAVELGKILGATVIAAASNDNKLKACKEKGADHLINYESEDLRERLKAMTNGKGIDVVYDAVGGKFSEPALRSMSWGGRYLVVGFASGSIPSFPANIPLLKGCSIVGVFLSGLAEKDLNKSQHNFDVLIDWMKNKKIHPSTFTLYPFEKASTAIQDLMNRKISGKAIVEIRK